VRTLTVIHKSTPKREPPGKADHHTKRAGFKPSLRRAIHDTTPHFTPLIDAKAASTLLGVPYTWLLAQARDGKIPHHRLGHYVRFNPDDLAHWLAEERIEGGVGRRQR
jgi:excisionase family DNA binding protein